MKKWLIAFIFLSFNSCEKNINFNLSNSPDLLVVDASIENGQGPYVLLNKSFDFFSTLNLEKLSNSFVHDAVVTISNGIVTHKLKEYAYGVGGNKKIYVYGIDSANLSTAFVGKLNTTYTLQISSEGKNYTAVTTIPTLARKMDSLFWKPAPFATDTNDIVVSLKATDPPGLGNYVRYFTKKNNELFLPGDNSVFDDQVIDGTTYEFQVDPGIDRNNRVPYDSNYFKRGDSITIKLCNIDKATYSFWSSWEFSYGSIGNPFAQPNKVIGNISNGALGAFYGYAAAFKSIVIPK